MPNTTKSSYCMQWSAMTRPLSSESVRQCVGTFHVVKFVSMVVVPVLIVEGSPRAMTSQSVLPSGLSPRRGRFRCASSINQLIHLVLHRLLQRTGQRSNLSLQSTCCEVESAQAGIWGVVNQTPVALSEWPLNLPKLCLTKRPFR